MSQRRWFATFAPVTIITIASIIALGLALLSTLLAMHKPWLGIEFDRNFDGPGIRVSQIKEGSPSADILRAGDIILAIVTPSQQRIDLSSRTILEDPDRLSSYAEYNEFFTHQQSVYQALLSPSLTADLSDNRQVKLTPIAFPNPLALPGSFWWLLFFGGASFLLGVSAWSMSRRDAVARVLAVSGFGFMIGAYTCGIYTARELVLPAQLFFSLAAANHLGIMVFAYASILFFWYYPHRLGKVPAAWMYTSIVAVIWLNETLQIFSWPVHVFYAHFLVAYSLLVCLSVLQWRKSHRSPLKRAALKWLMSTILVSLGFTVLMFYVPVILTGKTIASNTLTFCAVFLFYLGLVIGNIRYHQFDMDQWWVKAWQWLVFVFIALTADALFIYFLGLTEGASIGLAIGLGCLYLLARQWFWGVFGGNNNRAMERALPHLVETLIAQQQKINPEKQWQQLVNRVFDPLKLERLNQPSDAVTIERGGVALHLPTLDGNATIEAFCCEQGKRLYTSTDVNLAERLIELMRQSRDIVSVREQAALDERQRILRDLHDDVAARLLALLHQTREPAISVMAQNALRGLRDVVHMLGTEQMSLADTVIDIEANTREQLCGLGVALEWHSTEQWPDIVFTSQQHINLRRIARETIANALKHAQPQHIILHIEYIADELHMRICNDGFISDPANWIPKRGLNNIKSRVAEMGASHKWVIVEKANKQRYCQLAVTMPLPLGEDLETHPAD